MRTRDGSRESAGQGAASGNLQTASHPGCFVCGADNHHGMKLQFARTAEDAVEACFVCQPVHEGYAGILHGGAICAVLDGAMTNWLFAHGCIAVTADLRVRFRHPVAVGRPAVVRARLERTQRPVHCLKAELVQDQRVAATAVGRFMEKDGPRCFGDDHASRT